MTEIKVKTPEKITHTLAIFEKHGGYTHDD